MGGGGEGGGLHIPDYFRTSHCPERLSSFVHACIQLYFWPCLDPEI